MKTGFDASVPIRKPKTQIGRVLTELTSGSPEAATLPVDAVAEPEVVQDGAAARNLSEPNHGAPEPAPAESRGPAAGAVTRDAAVLRQEPPSPVSSEWERLAALRERLAMAAKPRRALDEPQHTAAAVGKVIEDLRARLQTATRERSETAAALDATRAALGRAETHLAQERRMRADVEAQAEERGQVAVQAVAEAEALAAERDLVLSELAERRRLNDEQAALLADAEAAFERHAAESATTARQLEQAREQLDLRAAEVADIESRLQAEAAKRAGAEARCRELEAEVARLAEAATALEAIRAMLGPQR